ncbi:MAG TPA: transporter [Candidatus Polarisedimenticolia bacterium]|nr:transporter [Candidatus Polarisedimenticolia bacterium]
MRSYIEVAALVIAVLFVETAGADAQEQVPPPTPVVRQSLDDAWWTGPILAPSAATLPRGHFLIEPYLYDVTVQGHYDHDGVRHSTTHSSSFGSLTYMLYGLADKVTIGLIPTAGFNKVSGGPSSSGVGLGDLSLQAQYRLTRFHEGSWIPTTSFVVQETFPTGKYDRLGNRPSDGFGGGSYSTTLAIYSQTYFWLPNGRILRTRLDVSQSVSKNVNVQGVSVYGTEAGFSGHAKPGNSFFVDASWEYSLTRSWVLALDATYRHDDNSRVTGYNTLDPTSIQNPPSIRLNSGSSEAFGFVPAIEYSWKSNLGVIFGTRVIPAGRNTAATITPAIAINFVH